MLNLYVVACSGCQFPFKYNGKEFTECTDIDAKQPWCPTAIDKNRTAIKGHWQFCIPHQTFCEREVKSCSSRETLDFLVKEFFDLRKTNPRVVAKKLFEIGCPFSCHYRDFRVELVFKKHDLAMPSNRLRLTFDLVPEKDSGFERDLEKDLDYTLDMFISDLGNGFGFLLGLSLMTVIRQFFASGLAVLKASYFSLFSKEKDNVGLQKLYLFTKWTVVGSFVFSITILSISRDFEKKSFLTSQSIQDKSYSSSVSQLFNKDKSGSEVMWGFLNQGNGQCVNFALSPTEKTLDTFRSK